MLPPFSVLKCIMYGNGCGQNANYQNSQISHFIHAYYSSENYINITGIIHTGSVPTPKSHNVSIKKPKCIKLCKNIIPVNCMNQT